MDARSAAFAANIVDVVLHDIFERPHVRVGEFGKIGGDIVVEVDFDVAVL